MNVSFGSINYIVIEAAEDDMREWLEQFMEEVENIELFFVA